MHNKKIEETIRDVLQKTYEDGQKNGKGGLGYSERAVEILTTLTSQIRQEERGRALMLIRLFDETPKDRQGAEAHIGQLTKFIARLKSDDEKDIDV